MISPHLDAGAGASDGIPGSPSTFRPSAAHLSLTTKLNREIVCHRRVHDALDFLQEALDFSGTGLESEIYILTGAPRVGKTAAVNAFRAMHGHTVHDGTLIRRVLFISITENNKSQSIYELLAAALGLRVTAALRNGKGGNDRFIAIVMNELRCQQVGLIVIDEAQKLALSGSEYRIAEMNEALKVQTNANVCGIVLVGTLELADLFEIEGTSLAAVTSRQMQGRVVGRHVFEPFTDEENDIAEYASVLDHLDQLVSGGGKRFGFAAHARLFLHLSAGRLGETNKLLNRLIRDAWRSGTASLTWNVIVRAQVTRVGPQQVRCSLANYMDREAVDALLPVADLSPKDEGRTNLHGKPPAKFPDFKR